MLVLYMIIFMSNFESEKIFLFQTLQSNNKNYQQLRLSLVCDSLLQAMIIEKVSY